MVETNIEILKGLLGILTDNPLNFLAIIGLSYIIKEVRSIGDIKDKVHKYENDIVNLRKDIDDLKKRFERLDDEHREFTRRGDRYH